MSEMNAGNAFIRWFDITEKRRGPEVIFARPLGTITDGQRPSANFNFGIKGQSLIAMTSSNDPMSRVVRCRTTRVVNSAISWNMRVWIQSWFLANVMLVHGSGHRCCGCCRRCRTSCTFGRRRGRFSTAFVNIVRCIAFQIARIEVQAVLTRKLSDIPMTTIWTQLAIIKDVTAILLLNKITLWIKYHSTIGNQLW